MPRRPIPGIERFLPARPRSGDGPRNTGASFYQKLVQVSVRNTYYRPTGECTDFTAGPTAGTAALMTDTGMLFRSEPDGFSVLYDTTRQAALLRYLRRREGPGHQHWTRLSFELALRNMVFSNFTRVPNDFDPDERNFYFSNQNAHERKGTAILNEHRYVTGRELDDVVPSQFPVSVTLRVAAIVVRDISGTVRLHLPRCVPVPLARARPAAIISLADVEAYFRTHHTEPREHWICRNPIYVDLNGLREGRYLIEEVDYLGRVLRAKWVLYVAAEQYVFIDLLFAASYRGAPGIYPIADLAGRNPTIETVHYELCFKRRVTYWRYYVVVPKKWASDTLAIETDPPGAASFRGPYRVAIGNATPASLFLSTRPLPMSTKPPARFILKSAGDTLMESMPVASIQQILPEADSSPEGNPPRYVPNFRDYSDIYVYV
jgi:hypothetical protein